MELLHQFMKLSLGIWQIDMINSQEGRFCLQDAPLGTLLTLLHRFKGTECGEKAEVQKQQKVVIWFFLYA